MGPRMAARLTHSPSRRALASSSGSTGSGVETAAEGGMSDAEVLATHAKIVVCGLLRRLCHTSSGNAASVACWARKLVGSVSRAWRRVVRDLVTRSASRGEARGTRRIL